MLAREIIMVKKQHCLTLELRNDPELIKLYEEYHQPGGVWPEVLDSIRQSGIEDMKIYRLGSLLIMVLEVDEKFSFDAKSASDASNPMVQKWERLMESFQKVDTTQPDTQKWQIMSSIFQLDDHKTHEGSD